MNKGGSSNSQLQAWQVWVPVVLGVALTGVGLLLASLGTPESAAVWGGIVLMVLGLFGDRLRSVRVGSAEVTLKETAAEIVAQAPPQETATDKAADSVTTSSEETTGTIRPEGELGLKVIRQRDADMDATARAQALIDADTPREFAAQLVEYLRTRRPGLRALSDERIELESRLHGLGLKLQTLRARGLVTADDGRVTKAVTRLHSFWWSPELFTEADVEKTIELLASLIRETESAD